MQMASDISDLVEQGGESGVHDRRSFLGRLLGIAAGAAAYLVPLPADAAKRWNISYGLAKGDAGLVALGKRYDEIKKILSPALQSRLVIEKSEHGNYFLVLRLNTGANNAQRMINAQKAKGIDAALRNYCNCEVVFPPKGAAAPRPAPQPVAPAPRPVQPAPRPVAPAPAPQPYTPPQVIEPRTVHPSPAPAPQPAPQPYVPPKHVPAQSLCDRMKGRGAPGARQINHPDFVQYSNLNFNSLESTLRRQFAHEVQQGNLSRYSDVICYVYDQGSGNMPVMWNSGKRIAGVGSAESLADDLGDADFYAFMSRVGSNRPLPRSGLLVQSLPGDARSMTRSIRKGNIQGEGAVIYARSDNSCQHYHTYTLVLAIQGAGRNKSAALQRMSRIVYEAMRSRYPLQ